MVPRALIAGTLLVLSGTLRAESASLSVTPVKVEVVAPGASATATLRNGSGGVLNAQIRVFRWSQENGEDRLTPTQDVVASPPVATMAPGRDYRVRLVRVGGAPVVGEESYRLVVDELPDPNRQRNGAVAVVLRYSVPLFFVSPEASPPRLAWRLTREGGQTYLSATNAGDRRVRLADLSLGGVSIQRGLAGYVLGRSTRRWVVRGTTRGPVRAQTEQGALHAVPGE